MSKDAMPAAGGPLDKKGIEDRRAELRAVQAEKKEEIKELRRQAMHSTPAINEPDLTDEDGIPFHRLEQHVPPAYINTVYGTLRYPLWTGKLYYNEDGEVAPRIVLVPCGENVNNGSMQDFYKKKGFKEVSAIPDRYAKFRDPYVAALNEWKEKELKKAERRRELKELGFKVPGEGATTTKTLGSLLRQNG